jgi:hypothetical protein
MAASTPKLSVMEGIRHRIVADSIAIALNGRPVAINLGFIDKQTRSAFPWFESYQAASASL